MRVCEQPILIKGTTFITKICNRDIKRPEQKKTIEHYVIIYVFSYTYIIAT